MVRKKTAIDLAEELWPIGWGPSVYADDRHAAAVVDIWTISVAIGDGYCDAVAEYGAGSLFSSDDGDFLFVTKPTLAEALAGASAQVERMTPRMAKFWQDAAAGLPDSIEMPPVTP